MVKDASYYIDRFDDLPSYLLDKIHKLSREANSNRFVCMSMQELCEIFELEYTEDSFIDDCQKCYAHIGAYLEKHNLKLVPCSIPVDLSFYDKIFVTPKPDLNNDEDCSIVRSLILSKRSPTPKDAVHISRMNNKLTNYNIMLRVFEALFVVSSSKLDFHQRGAINSIISSLEFPKEGLSYLRACYTYASEYRNRHCNFSRQEYCFKPLNTEQTRQICTYLAQIAASASYIEPFNHDYPYYNELEAEFNKSAGAIRKQQNAMSYSSSEYIEPVELGGYTLEKLFLNSNKMVVNAGPAKNSHSNYKDIICTDHPVKKNAFYNNLFDRLESLNPLPIDQLIPQKSRACFFYFDSVEKHRPFNGLYLTDKSAVQELYPNFLLKKEIDHKKAENNLNELFLAYLKNSTTLTKNRSASGTLTVTTELTNVSILLFNLFFKLVIDPLFIAYDREEINTAVDKLSKEYSLLKSRDLLLLRSLCFIFNDLPVQLDNDTVVIDDMTLSGLKEFPQIAGIVCSIIAQKRTDSSIRELYEICPQAFNFYLLNLAKLGSDKKANINKLKVTNIHTARFLDNILSSFIRSLDTESLDSLISMSTSKSDIQKTTYTDVINASSEELKKYISNSSNIYLFHHALFKRLIYPLFCGSLVENASGFSIEMSQECLHSINQLIDDNYGTIKYLSGCENGDNNQLALLLTDRLNKLDEQILKRKLKDLTFAKLASLCDVFKVHYTNSMPSAFEISLKKLGLMEVPIDSALPRYALSAFSHHKIISTNLEEKQLTPVFIDKLCASQMTMLIFCFTVPINTAEIRLAKMMDLTPEQNVFAIKFLNTIKSLILQKKAFDAYYYKALYAEQKTNENFRLCFKYLRQLAAEEIEASPLRSYVENKFNELFEIFRAKSVTDQLLKKITYSGTKPHHHKDEIGVQSENRPVAAEHRASAREEKQTFFKPVSFDIRKLNSDLIKSKIEESSMIQDVINQIRIEEGSITDIPEETASQTDAQPMEDMSCQSRIQTAPAESKYTYPSDSCRKLIEDIKSQNSEVIDLDEFNGLCLSLKFMSKDAAIEEVNDWAYENFDEPIFDVAYDENCVYITTSILDEL
ncbi:MAG: hypothetical protein ACI4UM_05860 [Succinivibrio sp.]